jgi:hypothetical protein
MVSVKSPLAIRLVNDYWQNVVPGMPVYLVCVFLHGMHLFLGVSAIGVPLHAVAFDIPRMWFCVVIRC